MYIDGQIYSGNHISKTQVKQKACENYLRNILVKQLSGRSAGNLKVVNCLTFNIFHIMYTCMYKYCHTFN